MNYRVILSVNIYHDFGSENSGFPSSELTDFRSDLIVDLEQNVTQKPFDSRESLF